MEVSEITAEEKKRRAGEYAASLVSNGESIGLGTGSTIHHFLIRLGGRVMDEELTINCVPTSFDTEILATKLGIPLLNLNLLTRLDLAVDGADQVDTNGFSIKGRGGAMTREKVVASAAERFVLIVDDSKMVDTLSAPVPVEVLPFAHSLVAEKIKALGGEPEMRQAVKKDGPVVTDNGNLILDVNFGEITDPKDLSSALSRIPGVVEHGIFEWVDTIVVGKKSGIEKIER